MRLSPLILVNVCVFLMLPMLHQGSVRWNYKIQKPLTYCFNIINYPSDLIRIQSQQLYCLVLNVVVKDVAS